MNLRILIVDDSLMFRKLIARYLLKRRGIEVIGEAESGDGALHKAAELKPDIVILDVSLPDRTCESVCAALKVQLPDTRIYLCSAHSDGVLHEMASSVEADGFLRKSLLRTDLLRMLEVELKGN